MEFIEAFLCPNILLIEKYDAFKECIGGIPIVNGLIHDNKLNTL